MSKDTKLAADKIREYMRDRRFTQKQMAAKMGITPNTLRSYLLQTYPKVTANRLDDIRFAMGVKEYIKLLVEVDEEAGSE